MTNGTDAAFATLGVIGEQMAGEEGLTKREYFAATALQGMIAAMQTVTSEEFLTVPNNAVYMADLLIAALNQENK